MKLCGIMPVRNEAWCLGLSARVALMWCDQLIVADHGSTDDSRDIMNTLQGIYRPEHFLIVDDREREWKEMEQRQMLLEVAREQGATHIAIIDADEILTGNLIDEFFSIQGFTDVARRAAIVVPTQFAIPSGSMLALPGYNLRGGIDHYHDNGIWGKRWFSVAFADDPMWHWEGDRFHSREPVGIGSGNHRVVMNPYKPIQQGDGGIMHLWGASERRLRAKSAWYKVTERLRWPTKPVAEIERMYNWAIHGEQGNPAFGTPKTWTYSPVPDAWWAPYKHLMKYLDVDAEPWQESEVQRLITEHGPESFRDLDLFGL